MFHCLRIDSKEHTKVLMSPYVMNQRLYCCQAQFYCHTKNSAVRMHFQTLLNKENSVDPKEINLGVDVETNNHGTIQCVSILSTFDVLLENMKIF